NPDRQLAQGLSRKDHRPADPRARDFDGRCVVGRELERSARLASPRCRADGRCDQGLDGVARLGGQAMSTAFEDVETSNRTIPTPDVYRVMGEQAKHAARALALADGAAKNAWLRRSAAALRERCDEILGANSRDVAAAPAYGLNAAAIDRLMLNAKRVG